MGIISTRVELFALSSSNINYTLNMNILYDEISDSGKEPSKILGC